MKFPKIIEVYYNNEDGNNVWEMRICIDILENGNAITVSKKHSNIYLQGDYVRKYHGYEEFNKWRELK